MSDYTIQTADVKACAAGCWPEILANLGGIDQQKLDGKHHPCPRCGGTDRFRLLDEQAGALFCNQCFFERNGDGFAALAWLTDKSFREVLAMVADYFGMTTGRNNGNGQPARNPVETIALSKDVLADAFRAFGATSSGQQVVFPCYGPDGKQCTTFSLSVAGGKGRFAKNKSAGLFFPHDEAETVRLPQPGEIWHVAEGVKDAAALHSLGLLACGLNTCRMAAKFARLFRGVDVILVPDRDQAGDDGATYTASVLRGVASSIRLAVLPAVWSETDGADVRDVLRLSGGHELVLQSITDAQPIDGDMVGTQSPQPADDGEPIRLPDEWVPFPTDVLPYPLAEFIHVAAKSLNVDESLVALPLLAGVASAIGSTRSARAKADWIVPPILWTVTVIESGGGKSPAIRAALRPIYKRHQTQHELQQKQLQDYEIEKLHYKKSLSKWNRDNKATDNPPDEPEQPTIDRAVVSDITIHALVPILTESARGVLVSSDEIAGWLESFTRFSGGKGCGDINHWLSLYDGMPIILDRKTDRESLYVQNPACSIVGGVQPGRM